MKDCVVKDWRVLCLLLLCTAVYYTASEQCTNGTITVNIDQPNLKAGRISICDNGEWKLICHHGWGMQEARVACKQLGFSAGAQFCRSSCFGYNDDKGLTDFACTGNENNLLQCSHMAASGSKARLGGKCKTFQVAGVLCIRTPPATTAPPTCPTPAIYNTTFPTCATCPTPATVPLTSPTFPCVCMEPPPTTSATTTPPSTPPPMTTPPPTPPPMTTPPPTLPPMTTPPPTTPLVMASAESDASAVECTAAGGGADIGAALGVVSVLLLLSLIVVITGWVWSRHRNKASLTFRETNRTPRPMFTNPTYSQKSTSSLVPAVQYSSLGPRDTPTNYQSPTCHTPTGHAPPQEERIYHMLEQPEGEGERKGGEEGDYQEIEVEEGEGVYHVLGEVGEGEGQEEGDGMVYEVPVQTKK